MCDDPSVERQSPWVHNTQTQHTFQAKILSASLPYRHIETALISLFEHWGTSAAELSTVLPQKFAPEPYHLQSSTVIQTSLWLFEYCGIQAWT
jgi:hypothetical protein